MAGIDRARQDGSLESLDVAFAPQSVTLRLADDLDVSRGDVVASARDAAPVARELSGTSGWLFRRNSTTGVVEALPTRGTWSGLNEELHAN